MPERRLTQKEIIDRALSGVGSESVLERYGLEPVKGVPRPSTAGGPSAPALPWAQRPISYEEIAAALGRAPRQTTAPRESQLPPVAPAPQPSVIQRALFPSAPLPLEPLEALGSAVQSFNPLYAPMNAYEERGNALAMTPRDVMGSVEGLGNVLPFYTAPRVAAAAAKIPAVARALGKGGAAGLAARTGLAGLEGVVWEGPKAAAGAALGVETPGQALESTAKTAGAFAAMTPAGVALGRAARGAAGLFRPMAGAQRVRVPSPAAAEAQRKVEEMIGMLEPRPPASAPAGGIGQIMELGGQSLPPAKQLVEQAIADSTMPTFTRKYKKAETTYRMGDDGLFETPNKTTGTWEDVQNATINKDLKKLWEKDPALQTAWTEAVRPPEAGVSVPEAAPAPVPEPPAVLPVRERPATAMQTQSTPEMPPVAAPAPPAPGELPAGEPPIPPESPQGNVAPSRLVPDIVYRGANTEAEHLVARPGQQYGNGLYFSATYDGALDHGPVVKPYRLQVSRPLVDGSTEYQAIANSAGAEWEKAHPGQIWDAMETKGAGGVISNAAQRAGYDAIVSPGHGTYGTEVFVFEPRQAKPASNTPQGNVAQNPVAPNPFLRRLMGEESGEVNVPYGVGLAARAVLPLAGAGIGSQIGEDEKTRRRNAMIGALIGGGAAVLPEMISYLSHGLPQSVERAAVEATRVPPDAVSMVASGRVPGGPNLVQRAAAAARDAVGDPIKHNISDPLGFLLSSVESGVRARAGGLGPHMANLFNAGRKTGERMTGVARSMFDEVWQRVPAAERQMLDPQVTLNPRTAIGKRESLIWHALDAGKELVSGVTGLPELVPLRSLSREAQQALEMMRDLLRTSGEVMKAHGAKVPVLEDYVPRAGRVNYQQIYMLTQTPEGRQAITDAAMSEFRSEAGFRSQLAQLRMSPGEQALKMSEEWAKQKKVAGAHYNSMEFERKWKYIPDWVIDPVTSKRVDLVNNQDAVESIMDHLRRTFITSQMWRAFGPKGETLRSMLESVQNRADRDSLAVLMQTALTGARPDAHPSDLFGIGENVLAYGSADPGAVAIANMKGLKAAGSLGILSAPKNLLSLAAVMSEYGIVNPPKAALGAVAELIPATKKTMNALMHSRAFRTLNNLPEITGENLALRVGALEPSMKGAHTAAALGMQGPTAKWVGKVTDWAPGLKATRWMDMFSRGLASYTGVLDTTQLLERAQRAYKAGVYDGETVKTLLNRNVHNAEELVKRGGNLTNDQVESIAYDAAQLIARADSWHKTSWMSTPIGSLFSQFANVDFAETVIGRKIIANALDKGDLRPVLRYMVGGTLISSGLVATAKIAKGEPLDHGWWGDVFGNIPGLNLVGKGVRGKLTEVPALGTPDVQEFVDKGITPGMKRAALRTGLNAMTGSGQWIAPRVYPPASWQQGQAPPQSYLAPQ